jgi:hypothetical protein
MRQCTRVRGQLSQRDDDSGEVYRGFIADVGFVISRVDGAEIFDLAEIILDEMAPPIFGGVMRDGLFPICFGRNDSLCSTVAGLVADIVIVEGFVAKQRLKEQAMDEVQCTDAVMALSGPQGKAHEITEPVHQCQNLRGQTAFRSAYGLIAGPPFAPLAF